MSWSFYPTFSSKGLIVVGLTFTVGFSSILRLIFYMWCKISANLSYCRWTFHFAITVCWKDCPFPIKWCWQPCWKSLTIYVRVYFRALCSVPFVCMFIFPVPHCFDYSSFVTSFEIRKLCVICRCSLSAWGSWNSLVFIVCYVFFFLSWMVSKFWNTTSASIY